MRVIAVAINHFVVEVMLIVLQFPFYVGQLSVELITLRFLCLLEYFIGAVSCHSLCPLVQKSSIEVSILKRKPSDHRNLYDGKGTKKSHAVSFCLNRGRKILNRGRIFSNIIQSCRTGIRKLRENGLFP